MEVATVIILSLAFPTAVIGMIWYWTSAMKKRVNQQKKKDAELVDILEKVVESKDEMINIMREKW